MMKRIWFIFKYRFNIGKDAKFIKALRGIGAKVNLHSKSAFFVNGKYEIDDVNVDDKVAEVRARTQEDLADLTPRKLNKELKLKPE